MTHHPIAQINRQKTDPEPAVSCEIDYFRSATLPPGSTAWRFFTTDGLTSQPQTSNYPAVFTACFRTCRGSNRIQGCGATLRAPWRAALGLSSTFLQGEA